MLPLHLRFVQVALKNLKKTAVIDTTRSQSFTYKQLLIASYLLSRKIKKECPDSRVGIMIPVSAGAIITKLAVLMAGKTPAMINYSTGAMKNCDYARAKAKFSKIITSSTLLTRLGLQHDSEMIFIEDLLSSLSLWHKLSGVVQLRMIGRKVHQTDVHQDAVILFTSGSEKDPKVVPLTHYNVGSNYDAIRLSLELYPEDRFIAVLPFFHVFGMTTSLWTPLLVGGTLITHANPLDYKAVVKSVVNYQATCLFATPAFFHGYNLIARDGDFSGVRILVAGGDKLPQELYQTYVSRHHVQVLEGYGTTELSPVVSVNRIGHAKLGSIGIPLEGVEVKIVSLETGEEVPSGTEGKLMVKGPNVMRGYLDDPEATASVLKDGWYDTGDIALVDGEGFIFHKGRYKRFLKIGGEMVSLMAVEEAVRPFLSPEVHICAIPIAHASKGAEVGLVVDQQMDFDGLKVNLSKILSPLMLPKHFFYVPELPLLGSGKVNFREVEKMVVVP